MKAILLSGGLIDEKDPLVEFQAYKTKGMIPFLGIPMVQWVLDALSGVEVIDEIYVIGMDDESILQSSKPIVYLPDQGALFANIQYGAKQIIQASNQDETIILASGDIPALTTEMVQWLIAQVDSDLFDLYYSVIPREIMEKTFPNSNRSYIHFRDIDVCGGDINVFNTRLFKSSTPLWESLTEARKNYLKQAAMVGIGTMLLILFKAISLPKAVDRICKKLKIRGKALPVPYAEMGMDVDKPHQLVLMQSYLEKRSA